MKFKFFALWISVVCILLFVLQTLIPGFTDAFVLDQQAYLQVWRFFTSIFLHGSPTHLIFNLFALIIFGGVLEGLIGGRRFLIVFIVTGIIANLISVNFYTSSLGASGAIFGVIGALIVVRPLLVVFAFGIPMPIIVAGVLWVFIDILGVLIPSNVANLAHLSGIFFGLILGAFYRDWRIKRIKRENTDLDEGLVRRWENYFMKDV